MAGLLDGKNIVVTGGARGIGSKIIKMAISEGGNVAFLDIEEPVTYPKDALFIKTDVSKEEDVRESFSKIEDKLGSVYGLVNNAAISHTPIPAEEVTRDLISRVFSINVFGTFFCTKYALLSMLKIGRGSVVNVSSVIGKVGSRNSSVYASSKAALLGMTKSNAVTYASRNIRFNAILPGYVSTPLIDEAASKSGDYESYIKNLISLHPLGRLGNPEEIAGLVVYLLSERSSFITGSEIVIDGGYTSI
jgi:NAD(P)-dependent dehydrogenase (short-subunit alcohol dehydrogenase family)